MNREPQSAIQEAEQLIRRYVVAAPGLPFVLALFSQATYLFECFDAFPYLAITSPTKRCGKTRTGELLELLCSNPLGTVSATPAVIFRSIANLKPTLIIDEAEALSARGEKAEALREILNAGHRAGRTVRRCEPPSQNVREFATFCPKVIILIGELPDTLADRCIPVQMKRHRSEQIERFRLRRAKEEAEPIRGAMVEWATVHAGGVADWYNNNGLPWLQDREEEIWLPLFAVCAVALPQRLPELQATAIRLSQLKADAEPTDYALTLLSDLRGIFAVRQASQIRTSTLVSDLNDSEQSPWRDWANGNGLNPRRLSRLLTPFGVRPENLRFGDTVVRGYKRQSLEDVWERYLPPDASASRYTATEAVNTGENRDSASATSADCSGNGNGEIANETGACSAVADGAQSEAELDAAIARGNAGRTRRA